jgi:WhiB family redox-sensing transcriptional regulator
MTITIHTESRPTADFTPDRTDWRTRAACSGLDDDTFFPLSREWPKIDHAKSICARCPVRACCLEYALTPGRNVEGIWGGTTDEDRAAIKRKRRSA